MTGDRTILSLTGADAEDFLQNLVTNDLSRLEGRLVYAALLSPQGKYLADFFLTRQGDAILLDVATGLAADLARRLTMYRLRADVQIAQSPLKMSRGTGPAPDGALSDPRHPALGWRLYSEGALPEDGTNWDALRVEHVIPESGIELRPDESYILENGFERLSGVDFKKGCYVGQEVTARMKHKTELRKGLAQVAIEGTAPEGSEITAEGKPAGTLFTQSGQKALAYLRFDRTSGPLRAGDATLRLLQT
ncbi:YgfZ/GcvT domain-containing protein [Pseudoruegeria sp. SHC-113]|uniref:CAF17-like 4Fe-4S cluster assembly/insertion protein YgfZ n=1 Tax=Pseudoruegeria sp. SHC-113 TaxID=2855439 RepID=UPI0021BAD5CF|nr:folate-binding protein [Pseudoruegeria sp. SHC-113]MCT8159540.1 folate-binding protein [Pseudoruegeria sp. SHC-113]